MDSRELKERTKKFTIQVIKFVDGLKQSTATFVLSKQIVRSATSIGANYRATCGARSNAEFITKLQIVREESDETLYWLELIVESGLVKANLLDDLIKENLELFKIVVSSITTMKKKLNSTSKDSESNKVNGK